VLRAWRAARAEVAHDRRAHGMRRAGGRGLLGVAAAFALLLLGAIIGGRE